MTRPPRPGRDRHAVLHRVRPGRGRPARERRAVVIGGGIAGIAAAAVLGEHGVHVTLLETGPRLGGRVSSWPLPGGRSMSRGFHAFFRQYYNLRALLRRADPNLSCLTPVADYPLVRADGMRDSFARVPRTPPWSLLGFVARSPAFTLRSLARVDARAALELVRVRFPETFAEHQDESAADFLGRLRFPEAARGLALEVFSRSFFADPRQLSAGELVAMFHLYFLGSAEGLLFDVPTDAYDRSLWQPLRSYLQGLGVSIRTSTPATGLDVADTGVTVHTPARPLHVDAAVLAADGRSARVLTERMDPGVHRAWRQAVAGTSNAPPFTVVRLWLDGLVDSARPAFVGTSGFGPVDNVTVLERFEAGARDWSHAHTGSVVELHAYACDDAVTGDTAAREELVGRMEAQLHRIYPETAGLHARHREVLVRDDVPVIQPGRWRDLPGVATPWPTLAMAGDGVRCDYPVALMERAATTGFLAANRILAAWGVAGQDVWTVPMGGLLTRRRWAPRP